MFLARGSLVLVAIVAGLLVALVGPGVWNGARADDGAAATLSVDAAAVSVVSGGAEHAGMDGETLYAGDTVSTNAAGAASITFFDGSQVVLDAGSRVVVQELGRAPAGGTVTDLLTAAGVTTSSVVPLVDGGSYEMHAPTSYAVVRGTLFRTWVVLDPVTGAVLEEGYSTTEGRGEVHVGDQVITLDPGQRVRIIPSTTGGPPQLIVERGTFLTSTESGVLGGTPSAPVPMGPKKVVDADPSDNDNDSGCTGGGTTPCP